MICGTGEEAQLAKQYAEYVLGQDGRVVMTRYGFALPAEALPSRTP